MYIDCFPDSEFVKTHFDKDYRGLRGQKACNHYDFEWWLSLFVCKSTHSNEIQYFPYI
jgi:hypothetical protein